MKKLTSIAFYLAPCLLLPSFANAQESNIGVGIKVGSTGFGIELTKPLSEALVLRASYNTLEYADDVKDTNVTYDGEIEKNSLSLGIDWHPWDSAFRLSAAFYNHFENKLTLDAEPNAGATYDFNNTFYDASGIGSVNGEVQLGDTTPYLGIGWGSAPGKSGFGYIVDLGVQFQDSPSIGFVVANCTLPGVLCTQLDSDLQVERAELEEDLKDFDLWPVLNLGVSYKF